MKKFQVKINSTNVEAVMSFSSGSSLTSRGGEFKLICLDKDGSFYSSIKAGNELTLFDNDTTSNVFGGYIDDIKRNVKQGKILEIVGRDYTSRLSNLMVDSRVFRKKELSVMVRDLAFQDLITSVDIDDCEVTTGWVVTGDLGSLTLDTSNDSNGNSYARIGSGCLKTILTMSSGTGSITKTITTGITIAETDSFCMYFFVSDASNVNTIDLIYGQDVSNNFIVENITVSTGWNYLMFKHENSSTNAGTPSLSNIIYFKVVLNNATTGSAITVRLDDIKKLPRASSNFRLDNVQITEVYLESVTFRNLSLFQCYQKICGIREDLYDFYVDIDKCINFGLFGTVESGETFSRGTNILSATFVDDSSKLHNDIFLYGGRQQYDWSESFNGTGSQDEFSLQYEPLSAEVTVGGIVQLGYNADSGTVYDYKIDQEAKKIIFATTSIPASGVENVVVKYTYSVPIVVRKKNSSSISTYSLRRDKIENNLITTVNDGIDVISSYLDRRATPLENGLIKTKVNTNVDVGETITFNDTNLYTTEQTFTVTAIKHFFIGNVPHSEFSVTDDAQSVEDFLADIFRRLNALENKEKGITAVTTNLEDYSEDMALTDTDINLIGKTRLASGFIIGHPTLGQIGQKIGGNTSVYGSDIIIGKSG